MVAKTRCSWHLNDFSIAGGCIHQLQHPRMQIERISPSHFIKSRGKREHILCCRRLRIMDEIGVLSYAGCLTKMRHNFESQLSSATRSQCGAKMVRSGSVIPPENQLNTRDQSLLQLTFSAASSQSNYLTILFLPLKRSIL